jgi:formylglycine-generating enzyme required for sulfatase activity
LAKLRLPDTRKSAVSPLGPQREHAQRLLEEISQALVVLSKAAPEDTAEIKRAPPLPDTTEEVEQPIEPVVLQPPGAERTAEELVIPEVVDEPLLRPSPGAELADKALSGMRYLGAGTLLLLRATSSLFMAAIRRTDRLLALAAGEGNDIIHNFLRFITVLALAALFASTPWTVPSAMENATALYRESLQSKPSPGPPEPWIEGELSRVYHSEANDESPPLAPVQFDDSEAKDLQRRWADHLGTAVKLKNSVGMKLTLIPPGEFLMGSPDSDQDVPDDEKPQHRVRITKPFYLGMYEVTQEQYERVMVENPSHFQGDAQRPVETVSWEDAMDFCRRLSEKEDHEYRLPIEAEWEYSCRAGTQTKYSFGDDPGELGEYAWFRGNSSSETHAVGQKKANAWGLYDMQGNVWEWCADWYQIDYYGSSPPQDPVGPSSGAYRVLRGGSWLSTARNSRSAVRGRLRPVYRFHYLGFRVARTP